MKFSKNNFRGSFSFSLTLMVERREGSFFFLDTDGGKKREGKGNITILAFLYLVKREEKGKSKESRIQSGLFFTICPILWMGKFIIIL